MNNFLNFNDYFSLNMRIQSELVTFDSNLPFLVRIFDRVNLDYPLHYHQNEYELTYTKGCHGTLIVGSQIVGFTDPDLVLTGPGLPHVWYETGKETGRKERSVTVIHFTRDIFPESWKSSMEFMHISRMMDNSERGLQFSSEDINNVAFLFSRIQEGQSILNYISILQILNELAKIKNYNFLSERKITQSDFSKDDERFRKVHTFINANFRKKIKLTDAAKLAGLSDSAFSHYFKKRTLKNFSEFIIDMRIMFAKEQLSSTSQSITSIAYDSGFNSISNFNSQFIRKTGLSPRKYRSETKMNI
jgi:AraC-like DNA-binding protein